MSEKRVIRINKVLRELNISLDRAVDFLKENDHEIESSPNAKISQEEYDVLCSQFSAYKGKKEASLEVSEEKKKEKEALKKELEKEQELKRLQEEKAKREQEENAKRREKAKQEEAERAKRQEIAEKQSASSNSQLSSVLVNADKGVVY